MTLCGASVSRATTHPKRWEGLAPKRTDVCDHPHEGRNSGKAWHHAYNIAAANQNLTAQWHFSSGLGCGARERPLDQGSRKANGLV